MGCKLGRRQERRVMDTGEKGDGSIDGRTIKAHRPQEIFLNDRKCSEVESEIGGAIISN